VNYIKTVQAVIPGVTWTVDIGNHRADWEKGGKSVQEDSWARSIEKDLANTGRDIFGELQPFWHLGFGLHM